MSDLLDCVSPIFINLINCFCKLRKYPDLVGEQKMVNYFENSANAWVYPTQEKDYFTSETILTQFETLFKLIEFKKEFVGHDIEILVENARTHTAKKYDLNLLHKFPGGHCPYDKLELEEDGMMITHSLYDEENISKGLFVLAQFD